MTNTLNNKRGITLLLLTVTLLLISTLLFLFTAKYSSLQQKISADLYRNQQAYEAAQAGLEAAIPYYQDNYAAIVAGASGGHLTPYVNGSTSNVALTNNSKYSFVYTNPTANNYQLVTITSTGVNAEASSTRVITQQIQVYSSSITPPTVTAETQGNIHMTNSATINNSATNLNIHSGSSVSFDNSSHTTTSSGTTSSSSKIGSDVNQNDSTLASLSVANLFQDVFGVSQTTVQNAATYTYTNHSNTSYSNLNGITGAVIWINQTSGTASLNNSVTVGSAAKPVILIVEGNLELNNSATVYGLVFVFNSTADTTLNNSATVNGAIVSTRDINFNNSTALNYNSALLNVLPSVNGVSTSYAKVPASWRDF